MITILFIAGAALGLFGLANRAKQGATSPTGPTVTGPSSGSRYNPNFFPTSQDVREQSQLGVGGPLIFNPAGIQNPSGSGAPGSGIINPVASAPGGSSGGTKPNGGGAGGGIPSLL